VWARLWSLPQGEDFDQARAGILDPQQLDRATIHGLAGFVHTFSHFRLQVTPIRVEVDTREAGIADTPDRGWFTRGELAELGLPAPVRKLLESLSPENPPCEPSIA
jgi:A/G-specific adenine glycosylase